MTTIDETVYAEKIVESKTGSRYLVRVINIWWIHPKDAPPDYCWDILRPDGFGGWDRVKNYDGLPKWVCLEGQSLLKAYVAGISQPSLF
jgi:hypothetical protein